MALPGLARLERAKMWMNARMMTRATRLQLARTNMERMHALAMTGTLEMANPAKTSMNARQTSQTHAASTARAQTFLALLNARVILDSKTRLDQPQPA
jgi:hypothetical protein